MSSSVLPATSARPLPASETKCTAVLDYPLWPQEASVQIRQDNSLADSTGRTVWLGAQVSIHTADRPASGAHPACLCDD